MSNEMREDLLNNIFFGDGNTSTKMDDQSGLYVEMKDRGKEEGDVEKSFSDNSDIFLKNKKKK